MSARPSRRRLLPVALFSALTCLLQSGCFSFSGPSDVRNQLVRETGVRLEKEQGLSIGPLGIAFVQLIAGAELPMSLDGLESVDVGVYRVCEESEGCLLMLDEFELDGWERIARVREASSSVVIMIGAQDSEHGLRRLLVLARDGSELNIVRVKGDLETLVATAFDTFGTGESLGSFELFGSGESAEPDEPGEPDEVEPVEIEPAEPVEIEWVRALESLGDFDVSMAAGEHVPGEGPACN